MRDVNLLLLMILRVMVSLCSESVSLAREVKRSQAIMKNPSKAKAEAVSNIFPHPPLLHSVPNGPAEASGCPQHNPSSCPVPVYSDVCVWSSILWNSLASVHFGVGKIEDRRLM